MFPYQCFELLYNVHLSAALEQNTIPQIEVARFYPSPPFHATSTAYPYLGYLIVLRVLCSYRKADSLWHYALFSSARSFLARDHELFDIELTDHEIYSLDSCATRSSNKYPCLKCMPTRTAIPYVDSVVFQSCGCEYLLIRWKTKYQVPERSKMMCTP